MGFTIRQIEPTSKFSRSVSLDAISSVVPRATIDAVLEATHAREQRTRKLSMVMVVWLVILLGLYPTLAVSAVMRKLAQGVRYLWPEADDALPTDAALCQRRYHLGARPLVQLFHQVCRPLATPQTPGAFAFGLRLMAVDGTVEAVPDTPANDRAFGRQHADRGDSAFPQVQGVYLVECGTHAIVDCGFWPYAVSERVGGLRLMRSVTAGMLVLWDRGFHSFEMLAAVLARGGHVLSRLPAHVLPTTTQVLDDGSQLVRLQPADYQRRKAGDQLTVRMITYTLTNPALPGYGEVHRLVTTLLDPGAYPAVELVCLYHERWEIEMVIDEIDTHQRLAARTVRSLRPVGVMQELYGIVIAHYIVRSLMHAAALEAEIDVDRLSFVHAVEVLHEAIMEFQLTAPSDQARLYQRLLREIASKRVPARRLRSNPRVVRQKMSKFKRKRPEHYNPPPICGTFRDTIHLFSHQLALI